MNQDAHDELLNAIAPDVEALMAAHRSRRLDWYFHELIPFEKGQSFTEVPWDPSQCTLAPVARTALVVNLLTEDNLPYYHAELDRRFSRDSVYGRWSRLWTSEEAQHATAIRCYLLTTRNCDPRELEDDRRATMQAGWAHAVVEPAGVFSYTAMQELATRVSHRNAGVLTDDPVAYEIMAHIARDENHHYLFYRAVVNLMLDLAPSECLQAIQRQFAAFEMPSTATPRFTRRAVQMARAGVYNPRIHLENVLLPLLRAWGVESRTGLTGDGAEAQDALMALPAEALAKAEAFESHTWRS